MPIAIAIWRQYPTEIEADLADRGHDIMDWHRGAMSSRRLLILLRHAPEIGPYKTALRDGDWPTELQMLKEIHKELALSRASNYAGTDYEYEPKIFVSPAEAAEQAAEEQAETLFREREFGGLISQLFGDDDDDSFDD